MREKRDTGYLSVFSPNAAKHGPEKIRIRTLFTQQTVYQNKYMEGKAPSNTYVYQSDNKIKSLISTGCSFSYFWSSVKIIG